MRIHALCFALAALLLAPVTALAQFGEVWRSVHGGEYHLFDIGDFDANGSRDFLTGESENSSGLFIGVRLAATGALQAQTAARYQPLDLFAADLDGDGPREILFRQNTDDRHYCFSFSGPPGPLAQRWSIRPSIGPAHTLFFADLDGNGRQYVVFQHTATNQLEVYTSMGALFGSYTPNPPMGWSYDYMVIQDFDGDGREEILLVYTDSSVGQYLIMLQSTSPVSVESPPQGLRAIELGSSFPNPSSAKARIDYSVPTRGPVTLRLLDVSGREVRVLVDGQVTAGAHQVTWDGRDGRGRPMPAGAYFYELTANGQRSTRKIVRLQ